MAARQVFQTTADYNAAAVLPRFVGVGEIHLLFRQERAQMLIDLLQRSVFEGFADAVPRPAVFGFVESGPVLDDLDAGKSLQDPALGSVVLKLGLLRFQALIECHNLIELLHVRRGVECDPVDQR